MPQLIDFTPQLAAAYSKQIEAEGPTQDDIDYESIQIMRGLSTLDVTDAIYDVLPTICGLCVGYPHMPYEARKSLQAEIGQQIMDALQSYCDGVARRKLEAA